MNEPSICSWENSQLTNYSLQEYFLINQHGCFSSVSKMYSLRRVWRWRVKICKSHLTQQTSGNHNVPLTPSPGLGSFSPMVSAIHTVHHPLQTSLFALSSPLGSVHCWAYRLHLSWHTSILGDNAWNTWLSYPGNGVHLRVPAYHRWFETKWKVNGRCFQNISNRWLFI